MTTRLTKPVRREVETRRHGPLIVTLAPEGIVIREKGRRVRYTIDYGRAYQRAVVDDINAKAAERRARRKARRK